MTRVVIVGGGISGLSTAYFLAKKNLKPVVFEKERETGGLGWCHRVDGMYLDSGYHIIFRRDEHILTLLRELGLERNLVWGDLDFRLVTGEGDIQFSPLKILSSRFLPLSEKISLAKIYLKMKNLREWKHLDKLTAKEWITRNGGPGVYKKVFKPIIEAKWGKDSGKASAAWFYGRLKPRSDSRNIFGGREKAGYLRGSFKKLFSVLEREIRKRGGKITTSANVRKISMKGGRVVSVEWERGKLVKEVKTDLVVSTVPVQELLRISQLPLDFAKRLKKIEYKAVICVTFGLKKAVTNSFRTVFSERRPFGGLVEMTNLIDKRCFRGNHILYAFSFLDTGERLWNLEDEEVVEMYANELEELYPGFGKLVLWSRLYRNRYGEPFYRKNYLKLMPGIRTPVKGLFITGMVQSYPVSDFNNIIALASETSNIICREVRNAQ